MKTLFYASSAVALLSTALVITGRNPVHALLYLVVSLLASALVFYSVGAPFAAALEAIIYAGAIMVLFVFVIMMLGRDVQAGGREKPAAGLRIWAGPSVLSAVLLIELIAVIAAGRPAEEAAYAASPKSVGMTLFGPYLIGVELASFLLLAALVGAFHLGRREGREG